MLRRILFIIAALVLFSAGYLLGTASRSTTQALPAQQGNCRTFTETGKTVCGRFLAYWTDHGGLAQQGFPISEEFQEKSDLNGQIYTVQYFERAVFEYHPENQPPFDVLLSQLGTFRYREKYGNATPAPTSPPGPPTAIPTPPGPPAMTKIGNPVERNGIVFNVVKVNNNANKRLDVLFTIENRTANTISFTVKNSDQQLTDAYNTHYSENAPDAVVAVTLQPGQIYNGGTSFNVDLTARTLKGVTYIIANVPGIGTVIVDIPLPV